MTSFGSFSDLASIKGNTVEQPKPLPGGVNYIATFSGPFKEHKSAKKGTLAMRFPIRLQGAVDEAVQAEITADEGLSKALNRDYYLDFWLTPESLWRFTGFATAMGVSDELNILEMGEALVASGTPFTLQGKLDPPQDGSDGPGFFKLDNPAPLS